MRSIAFAALTAITFVGCSEENRSNTGTVAKPRSDENRSTIDTAAKPVTNGDTVDREATTVTAAKPVTEANGAADRDNTTVNKRDRNAATKTPIDQNENKKDIDVTANIRKRVVDTKMSVNAQNVKIVTQDGKVTLRGPVKSADEKKKIEDIAHDVAGKDNVDSQLEVEKNP